jgi:hypothetical protein
LSGIICLLDGAPMRLLCDAFTAEEKWFQLIVPFFVLINEFNYKLGLLLL